MLAALAAPAWAVRLGVVHTPLWVLAAWGLATLGVAGAGAIAVRVFRGLAAPNLARVVEASPGWRRGSVNSVLQGAAAGTSAALYEAADVACARKLSAGGPAALAPLRSELARRAGLGVSGLVAVGMLFLLASPLRQPMASLWAPGDAWAAFRAPLSVAADRAEVDRGESVVLLVRAVGRGEAVLWTRGKGEGWRAETVALDSTSRAEYRTGPLEGDLYAFVRSGARTSDTVMVRVRLPAFLGSLSLTARYPAYLGLDDEALPVGGDTLLLPTGTRLDLAGEATAPLARVAGFLGGDTTALEIAGSRFRGRLTPRASGVLGLLIATADGAPLGSDPVAVPIVLVPDRPPEVELPVPDGDTVAVLGSEVPLVIHARDDHGLTGLAVRVRRLRRADSGGVDGVVPLGLPPGTADRALISPRLDLGPLALQPGDTVLVWVEARDNSPTRQVGYSRVVVLVVPTGTEARAEQRSARDAVARQLDSLAAESRRLQRQTEDLSRERAPNSRQGDRGENSLGFEDARRAEQVARDQQELIEAAEEARDQIEALERAAERAGIADSAFQARLEEIRAQLDKALTAELRKRLEELREALKNLDPQTTREALRQLAQAQERLREALERTRELFRRAAVEGELASLEQETRDLVAEQQAWNEQVAEADRQQAAQQEEALAQRADSVAQGLNAAARQLDKRERSEALRESASQARQAAEQMREAAQSARTGQPQRARQQGQQAAGQLSQARQQVQQEREAQQGEWRQEVVEALDRALAETARLTRRQLALSGAIGRSGRTAEARAEQAVIEEGVQKVLVQITEVGGKNALISPQIGAALVQARLQMARAREAISSAAVNLREATEQAGEAVDALNVAAYQMLRSRDDVAGASSASGVAEAIERMQQLAGQQGSLSQEGNNLLSMLGMPQFQQQLAAMAQRQRELAQELERLRAQTQAPGTRDLAEEARELARRLEAGRLDRETTERQERLFRRMLDAGRTLQGEEKDEQKERQSETAKGDSVSIPPRLRRLLDQEGRIRLPSWEELQRLSPEERRLVTDYFRRLTAREPR